MFSDWILKITTVMNNKIKSANVWPSYFFPTTGTQQREEISEGQGKSKIYARNASFLCRMLSASVPLE